MNNYWVNGQVVRVVSIPIGIYHYGILAITPFGLTVIHNTKCGGVREDSFETFADGQRPEISLTPCDSEHGTQVVARAREMIGATYVLDTSNCEHLVTYAFYGKAESPTFSTMGTLCLVTATILVLAWPSGSQHR